MMIVFVDQYSKVQMSLVVYLMFDFELEIVVIDKIMIWNGFGLLLFI